MIEKEVNMSRQIKILAYVGVAVVAIVSWASPGAGTYVPLKAKFIFDDQNEIRNYPEAAGEYAYVDSGKPQGNPWIWFDMGTGRFRMTVARKTASSGPYVWVSLNNVEPGPFYSEGNCAKYPNLPTLPSKMQWFWFTSGAELRDNDGDGFLEASDYPDLSFKDMNVGDVKYCTMSCRFQTFDDQCEYDWGEASDTSVKVQVLDVNGTKEWVVTPYVSPAQDCTNRKLWRSIYLKRSGAGYGGRCDLGIFEADFELHIALK
jgi:hypothetical protein